MMAQLEHWHCTARSTVLAAQLVMLKYKSGEGGQTAVGLDPINEGVQPDVLQRGRAGMARQRSGGKMITLESGPVVPVGKEYRKTLFSAQYVKNGFTNGAVVCVVTCRG